MIRILLPLLFLLYFTASHSQEARQYSFKHFSVSNGLVSNIVGITVQDAEGYIWIATINGLQRYDGQSFITFKHNPKDLKSIPSSHLYSLYIDKKNNLWVAGENQKVGIFDTRKFTFREIKIRNPKPLGNMRFMELPTGELVLIGDGVVFKYEADQDRFVNVTKMFHLPPNWKLTHIFWDQLRKRYWISCDSGLVQFNPAVPYINCRLSNPEKDPVIEKFKDQLHPYNAFADKKGNVTFSFWGPTSGSPVIRRWNNAKKEAETISLSSTLAGYHEIINFLEQRNGRMWVFGMPFFLEWRDEGKPGFKPLLGENLDEPPIKFDYAYHAMEDREGNLWISTDNGIYLFNPDKQIFNTYGLMRPGEPNPTDRPVTAVQQLKDGRIFIGTWGSNGLYCYDNALRPLALPSSFGEKGKSYTVWDMGVNKKTGNLWITLQGGGLVVYDPKSNKVTELYPEVFGRSTIRQVDDDTAGNMWFGTQSGRVVKWDYARSGADPSKGYAQVLQTGMVLKVHYDYQGYVYVATDGWGLIKLDANTNQVLKTFTKDGPAGERIYTNSPTDMTYYNDTSLIITAGCLNILNTKTNKIRYIDSDAGLPTVKAQSVEKDESGILWVGMTNGICRVNLEKKVVSYYDRRDGIAYDKFSQAGVQELTDGRLVFFTDHNLLVFDPNQFRLHSNPPRPLLTSFRIGDQAISMDSLKRSGRAVVNYDNTSIGISFSALSYMQQAKVLYEYQLEGVDKEWIHADKPLEATYNYLAPGYYTFRVKSRNADGNINNDIATLAIVVRPPFWNTWWFYGLVVLLVITILYVIDKERMSKRNSMRSMRRQIAGNLHSEISNTLNSINVLSEIAKIKADKNVEQSKEFITQISNKSRYMIEAMDDMLWSIDPQNDSMRKTILRIRELTEGLRSTFNTDIDLIIDHKIQTLELDMKFRHELFFFYKEAITLLLKEVPCSQVFININKTRSRIMIEIIAECDDMPEDFVERFNKALEPRVQTLDATVDVIGDADSFSAAIYVNV